LNKVVIVQRQILKSYLLGSCNLIVKLKFNKNFKRKQEVSNIQRTILVVSAS